MEEFILGIDDAGRGPIIGSMILAGVIITKSDESKLKEWGVTDSKKITREKRDEIVKKIKQDFEFHFEITTAEEIDMKTNTGINLNHIEAIKAARIINNLTKNKNSKIKVTIDCPSTNLESWKNCVISYVEKKHLEKVEVVTEHKADVNHLACSAASIVAKTTRDNEIDKLRTELNVDFGSGYQSDPTTYAFLEKNLDLLVKKGVIRKTWETYSNLIGKKEQKKLF